MGLVWFSAFRGQRGRCDRHSAVLKLTAFLSNNLLCLYSLISLLFTFIMALARCGRLARLSLGSVRPAVAVSPRAFVARSVPLVRGVSSNSRDAQQKVFSILNGF